MKIQTKFLAYPIVSHCTLKCDGCGSKSELRSTKASFISVDVFEKDIKEVSKFISVKEFAISGGEPLLHKNIIDLLKIVKRNNFCDLVQINTNGQLIDRQPDEFWKLIDKIVLSLYPNTPIDNDYVKSYVKAKCDQYGVEFQINSPSEFMQIYTVFSKSRNVQKTFDECKIAHDWHCHAIYDGRYYKCAGPIVDKIESDGVILEEEAVRNYLQSKTPLTSCYSCLGTSGPKIPHRQVT